MACLERYCVLLWDWNSKLNLTRHTDYDTFDSRDIVDSRELASYWRPAKRCWMWAAEEAYRGSCWPCCGAISTSP